MTGPRTLRAFPIVAMVAIGLALGACAHNTAEDLSGAYGVGGYAGPGSVQEFSSTVGDRVFFETDQTELTSAGQARSTSRRRGSIDIRAILSPSKGMPTCGARANTISRSGHGAPRRPRIT